MATTKDSPRLALVLGLCAAGAWLVFGQAFAQDTDNTAEAAALERAKSGVAAMGRQWTWDTFTETVRLYADVHREIDSTGIKRIPDLHYGADDEQSLDLYVPVQDFTEPGPVIVFLHGNGLERSDKNAPGSGDLIYGNVARLAARGGGIGVNADYRRGRDLEPFAGATDLRLLLEWLRENVGGYGGDTGTLVLIGNSEGARNIATYLFHEPSQMQDGPGVAAAVLSSGMFTDSRPGEPAIFDLVESYSGTYVPIALWSAELDPPYIEDGVSQMYSTLCAKLGECPTRTQFDGYNHVSHIMSIDTVDQTVVNALIRFYHTVR